MEPYYDTVILLGAILGVHLGKIPYVQRLTSDENTDGMHSMRNIIFAYYHTFCNCKGTNLSLVDDNRFIELTVEKDCELKTFIEDHNIKFVRGAAFYEFTRAEEDIKFDKEVILVDVV